MGTTNEVAVFMIDTGGDWSQYFSGDHLPHRNYYGNIAVAASDFRRKVRTSYVLFHDRPTGDPRFLTSRLLACLRANPDGTIHKTAQPHLSPLTPPSSRQPLPMPFCTLLALYFTLRPISALSVGPSTSTINAAPSVTSNSPGHALDAGKLGSTIGGEGVAHSDLIECSDIHLIRIPCNQAPPRQP